MKERTAQPRRALPVPSSTIDLWSDEVLRDPYPAYATLRQLGPVVYLEPYDLWAVTHHHQVRRVLADHRRFTSTAGIGLNDEINKMGNGILAEDLPRHDIQRELLAEQLSPRGVNKLRGDIECTAGEQVASVVAKGSFDAVTELAEVFPVSVVAALIGLPEGDRDQLLGFAESAFTSFGPLNDRTREHLPNMKAFLRFCAFRATRETLTPGSWGQELFAAADRGVITEMNAVELLGAYLGAGMDTTISAVSSAIMLFGQSPDQWEVVRAEPSILNSAFHEILRLESPIQFFSRVATEDAEVGDVEVPGGSRVLVMYGCANRDEQQYPNPDRFDVGRKPSDHLAFGHGLHNCAGQFLARVETLAIVRAFADQVSTFEIGSPTYLLNNITRRLASVPVTVEHIG